MLVSRGRDCDDVQSAHLRDLDRKATDSARRPQYDHGVTGMHPQGVHRCHRGQPVHR